VMLPGRDSQQTSMAHPSGTPAAQSGIHLGSPHINFVGPEVRLIVGYGTLLSQLTYVRFPSTIDGLSRGQVVASISVAADIISDKLRLR
jgi:hypothetical protein